MKILFLCTAHNSLSQRLYLELSSLGHDVSIEYALSDETMEEAVSLFTPDLVVCPFLTTRVPRSIYNKVLTLIIHPGPPDDAGPSALDWLLMGDDGLIDNDDQALIALNNTITPGRTHWGVTVIQAIEDFDAGPVWAFEQFALDIEQPTLTKSELYRGPVTRAAVTATKVAIERIDKATQGRRMSVLVLTSSHYMPSLRAKPEYARLSVTDKLPFQGGPTLHRPILKAAQRDFDLTRHTATHISRRIRSADSQPGVLSRIFGVNLYVYGGIVEQKPDSALQVIIPGTSTTIIGIRNEAVCIATCDGKGIWISHVRRPKEKDEALQPKVPAVFFLAQSDILTAVQIRGLQWLPISSWSSEKSQTLQDVWVDILLDENHKRTAYLYWEFYNGAMATEQCSRIIDAMEYILTQSTPSNPIHAVALMGGSYFCNGIALNVAEAAADPAQESWLNISRINDVVYYILHEFPSRGILTVSAIRGNSAAGGVALAAACDICMAGSELVLNPAYRAIGLYGSEYHTLSYYARCGQAIAEKILRSMQPISPIQAQRIGLVDYVFPGIGEELDDYIRSHISFLLRPGCLARGFWKAKADISPATLARTRAMELGEMSKDFWSPRSMRYHSRRFDFVRKVKPARTPLRFAKHRRPSNFSDQDEEERDTFDDVDYFRKSAEETLLAELRRRIYGDISPMRRLSVVGPPEKETNGPTVNAKASVKADTLFACYYKPVEEPLTPFETPFVPLEQAETFVEGPLTPPETPLNSRVQGIFFDAAVSSQSRLPNAIVSISCAG